MTKKIVFLMRQYDLKDFYKSFTQAAKHIGVSRTSLNKGPKINDVQYLTEYLSLKFEKITNGRLKTEAFVKKDQDSDESE